MSYKYVIFDVDGTLIDPIEGMVKALDKLVEQNQWESKDFRKLNVIGPPMKKSLMRIFGFEEEYASKCADAFREIYINETLFDSVLYPGVQELFNSIHKKGIKIGIATYKRTDCAKMIIEHYGLSNNTDAVCGDNAASAKTKADIIKSCMEELNVVDKKSVIMVGDTLEDYKGAKEAGVDFCGVTYGYGIKDRTDSEIENIVDHPLELLNILEAN